MSSATATEGTSMEESDLLPDDVEFTNADIDRAVNRPKLRANSYYRFKVTGAKNRVFPKGTIYAELTVNPLDPDGKTRGPSAKLKLNYPFANPKVSGHKAPDITWAWEKTLAALYPAKYGANPRRQKDGTWITLDGQVIDKDGAKAISKGNAEAVLKAAQAYFRNVNDFVDEVLYASIEDTDYRDVSLKTVCSEVPPGVEPRMSDFADI